MSPSTLPLLSRRGLPAVENLEGRLVPSGTPLDLTARGSEGAINGAIFRQTDAQPTGTGVISSFVRVQTNATQSQGYNTDTRPLQFDENNSPRFTRSLKVGDAPLVNVGGVAYREFLLDINQKASSPLLSLDQLRVYVSDGRNPGRYDPATRQLGGLDPVYDMDAGGDNWVKLDYRLNSGSGSGDMKLFLPASTLGPDPTKYLTLYSAFGENQSGNAGFEEWAVRPKPTGVARLSGHVYQDDNQNGLFDQGEHGIAGVTILLAGRTDDGQDINLSVTTDANGFYEFSGLGAGVYSLQEYTPPEYTDGTDSIGTQGGQVSDDRFFDIYLAAGIDGRDNNFGEVLFTAPS